MDVATTLPDELVTFAGSTFYEEMLTCGVFMQQLALFKSS